MHKSSFLAVLTAIFLPLSSLGATHVWTGAVDDRFSNAGNWIGGSPAGDAAADLSFPADVRTSANNDLAGLTIHSIAFSGSGYTIAGNPLGLAAGATIVDTVAGANTLACDLVLAGDVEVDVLFAPVVPVPELTLSGAIGGSGGVSLAGGGRLIYAGTKANSYGGTTHIAGELQLRKSPGITAVPATVLVEGTLSTFADEQIADNAPITLASNGSLLAGATETIGPLTLDSYANPTTRSPGKLILAGDVQVNASSYNASTFGTLALAGNRTITLAPGSSGWNVSTVSAATSGAGLTVIGPSSLTGSYSPQLQLSGSYDGPTTIEGSSVSLNDPATKVVVHGGRFGGRCASLTATGGELNSRTYFGGIESGGDVRLTSAVSAVIDVSGLPAPVRLNGALDLGGATLTLTSSASVFYGTVYPIISNASSQPVTGTFAGLPEGSIINGRWKLSYAGGDGNDVTVTDVGLGPSWIDASATPSDVTLGESITLSAHVVANNLTPTGTISFIEGANVVASAQVSNGRASASVTLPRGDHSINAVYSGDSRVSPVQTQVFTHVRVPKPVITSIDPPQVQGGTTVTLTLRGTDFQSDAEIFVSSYGYEVTFISPTELRFVYIVPAYTSDTHVDVTVSSIGPGSATSAAFPLAIKAAPAPPTTKLVFGASSVSAPVSPGAMTAWSAVAYGPEHGIPTFNLIGNLIRDSDNDGLVTLTLNKAMPLYGIWTAVDLNTHTILAGRRDTSVPEALPFPQKMFLRNPAGDYSHLIIPLRSEWLFLLARPGVGAWMTPMTDGAPADLDQSFNGKIVFETTSLFKPLGDSPPAPAGVEPGDVFIGIDDRGQQWFGDTVTNHLGEAVGPGVLTLPSDPPYANEADGVAKIVVLRAEGSDGRVSVQYATSDGTAHAGTHYQAKAGTLVFDSGEILKTIEIPLINDETYSAATTFKLTLSKPSGATIGGEPATNVNISDDEKPPALSFLPGTTSLAEGDSGTFDIPVRVGLSAAARVPVSVNWSWSTNGLAGANGQLQFAPGETEKSITVRYTANTTPEPDRVITVSIHGESNATVATPTTTVTIVDDDFATVTIADASVKESAGNINIPLVLSQKSLKPVTVAYETRDGSAIGGSDYQTKSGTVTFPPNTTQATLTIPVFNDAIHESFKWFNVALTSADKGRLGRSTAVVTITDDDTTTAPAPPKRRAVRH